MLEYAFVSSSLVSAIVVAMVVYVLVDAEIFFFTFTFESRDRTNASTMEHDSRFGHNP